MVGGAPPALPVRGALELTHQLVQLTVRAGAQVDLGHRLQLPVHRRRRRRLLLLLLLLLPRWKRRLRRLRLLLRRRRERGREGVGARAVVEGRRLQLKAKFESRISCVCFKH